MNHVTTTDLRTKTSKIVHSLVHGNTISLVHRSRIIGEIRPVEKQPKVFSAKAFKKLAAKLNLPKTTYAERERLYRKHLMDKYGKSLS